jgi:hypothetical protein
MYNVDSGNLGAKTGVVFVGTTTILLVAGWLFFPDITCLIAEQIDHGYELCVPPRQFQKSLGSGEFIEERKKGLEA